MGRGVLTEKVDHEAMSVLGRKLISSRELRMMPYVQYVMMNDQRLDPNKVSAEERGVLKLWREEGYIEGGASGLHITREFWDAINHILWFAYVDYE